RATLPRSRSPMPIPFPSRALEACGRSRHAGARACQAYPAAPARYEPPAPTRPSPHAPGIWAVAVPVSVTATAAGLSAFRKGRWLVYETGPEGVGRAAGMSANAFQWRRYAQKQPPSPLGQSITIEVTQICSTLAELRTLTAHGGSGSVRIAVY